MKNKICREMKKRNEKIFQKTNDKSVKIRKNRIIESETIDALPAS